MQPHGQFSFESTRFPPFKVELTSRVATELPTAGGGWVAAGGGVGRWGAAVS